MVVWRHLIEAAHARLGFTEDWRSRARDRRGVEDFSTKEDEIRFEAGRFLGSFQARKKAGLGAKVKSLDISNHGRGEIRQRVVGRASAQRLTGRSTPAELDQQPSTGGTTTLRVPTGRAWSYGGNPVRRVKPLTTVFFTRLRRAAARHESVHGA